MWNMSVSLKIKFNKIFSKTRIDFCLVVRQQVKAQYTLVKQLFTILPHSLKDFVKNFQP